MRSHETALRHYLVFARELGANLNLKDYESHPRLIAGHPVASQAFVDHLGMADDTQWVYEWISSMDPALLRSWGEPWPQGEQRDLLPMPPLGAPPFPRLFLSCHPYYLYMDNRPSGAVPVVGVIRGRNARDHVDLRELLGLWVCTQAIQRNDEQRTHPGGAGWQEAMIARISPGIGDVMTCVSLLAYALRCVSVQRVPTPRHRKKWGRRRRGCPLFLEPPELYTPITIRPRPATPASSTRGDVLDIHYSHRWDRAGHYACRVYRGEDTEDADIARYVRLGYAFYPQTTRPTRMHRRMLAGAGHKQKQGNEWLAIKTWWVNSAICGPADAPYIPKIRVHEGAPA